MKTILKSLILASLLLVPLSASAQKVIVQDLESWMSSLISRAIENNVEVDKNLGLERDIQKEGNPLKWRCDILTFKLPKKQRPLLEDMITAFEENGHNNPNCYGINSKRTGTNQAEGVRNLMIGDDRNNYVTIGENYGNYLNVNILDVTDTTKTHRYAYALEWKEDRKGNAFVRYIVTYAKIPSATSSITSLGSSFLDLGRARANLTFKGPVRFQWDEKVYPIEKMDSVLRDVKSRREHISKQMRNAFVKGNSVVLWADSLDHDTDPVTDVVLRLQQGKNITADDLLCNDNVLLIFSQLKQQYLAGQNTEFNAISIYALCRRAYDYGFFSAEMSIEELEQIMCDVDKLIEQAKTETDRKYFQMAREQLDKILKSRK